MFKRFTHHPDGHKLPRVGAGNEDNGSSIPGRFIWVRLPFGWVIALDWCVQLTLNRHKLLASGDLAAYNEPIAPDYWADQPKRPNGSRW